MLRAGVWTARGLRVPARNALLADIVPGSMAGPTGLSGPWTTLAPSSGPLLAIGLVGTDGVRWAIGLSVIPGLLAALAIVYAIRHTAAQARRDELDGQREAVESAADEGERRIEEAEREAEQRTAKEAEAKRSATRTAAATRRQAVNKQAARTDVQRARSQGEALRTQKAAVRARGKALELDGAVQAKKSSRRSG
jgi:MFS family permease